MDADGWITTCKNGKNKQYTKYTIAFKNTSLVSPQIYSMMIDIGLNCGILRTIKAKTTIRNGKLSHAKKAYEWSINPYSYISTVGFAIERKRIVELAYLKDRGYACT